MTECVSLRGGSWDNFPRHCRSADRLHNDPGGTDGSVGFRVACAADRKPIERVPLRGGSWFNGYPWLCRSAYRAGFLPDYRSRTIGFRVCCPVTKVNQFTTDISL